MFHAVSNCKSHYMQFFMKCRFINFLLMATGLLSFETAAQGVSDAASSANEPVTVIPGAHYRAGGLHKFFFGSGYRKVWTTPVKVPVLDLENFAGGLTPTRRGGGLQTLNLRFQGGDGREYAFRSLDKDPSRALPEELQGTIVESLGKDQISVLLPFGALVASKLADQVGVLHAKPQYVVMPRNEKLGEHLEAFGGVLGSIEERPGSGFAGSKKVEDSEKFYQALDSSSQERIDAQAYLTARLLDILIGDWDRHADQWNWARFAEGDLGIWKPIPKDRDLAFVIYNGVFPALMDKRWMLRHLDGYNKDKPDIISLTHKSRYLDNRLLSGLVWKDWEPVIQSFVSRLDDAALQEAVQALPPEVYDLVGADLIRKLQQRRGSINDLARAFYLHLAQAVDIQTTDQPERAVVTRLPNGDVAVMIYDAKAASNGSQQPFYSRTFARKETDEVRLYLLGGDDVAEISGEGSGGVRVRLVGGEGNDHLVASASVQNIYFYDSPNGVQYPNGSNTRVILAASPRAHQRPPIGFSAPTFTAPAGRDKNKFPEFDHSYVWKPLPYFGYDPDNSFFIGGGAEITHYGFRQSPYADKMSLAGNYAFKTSAFHINYTGDFYNLIPGARVKIKASTAVPEDRPNFYGFGNESFRDTDLESEDFYRAQNNNVRLQPHVYVSLAAGFQLLGGFTYNFLSTDLDATSLVRELRPYGVDIEHEIGFSAGFEFDTRDLEAAPYNGIYLTGLATHYPEALDNRNAFTKFSLHSAVYYSPVRPLTLAWRGTGETIEGRFPYYDAVYLGGKETLRGFRMRRFAGNSAFSGSAEARLLIKKIFLIFPGDFGIIAFTDFGRAWFNDESPGGWHNSAGGGIFLAPLYRQFTISFTAASSVEGLLLNGGLGFAF